MTLSFGILSGEGELGGGGNDGRRGHSNPHLIHLNTPPEEAPVDE